MWRDGIFPSRVISEDNMIWNECVTVNSHDCDKNGFVRPTGLFRIVQEAAFFQLHTLGQDETKMHKEDRAYIVSHIGIDVKAPLRMGDRLSVHTWESGSTGVKFNRFYSVTKDGEEVVLGSCVCALIDTDTGRIMRVAESGYTFGTDDEWREPSLSSRSAMNKELCYKEVGKYPVLYAFIDRNAHMNNTCYADMMFSALPDAADKVMTAISVSYLRQAKLGDVLTLELAEQDGVYYVKSVLPDGTLNAVAAIKAETV